jgi:hypothetical protein
MHTSNSPKVLTVAQKTLPHTGNFFSNREISVPTVLIDSDYFVRDIIHLELNF